MKRIVLAALAGGTIMFLWGALSHMVLPLGGAGITPLPNEGIVLAALETSLPASGMYFYPALDMTRTLTAEEQKAWEEKYRSGPTGMILFHREGSEPLSPRQLFVEWASNVVAAAVIAFVLIMMSGTYLRRVLAVALLGTFVWLSVSVSYWNWYGFPTAFIMAELIDQTVGWGLAGLALVKMVTGSSAARA